MKKKINFNLKLLSILSIITLPLPQPRKTQDIYIKLLRLLQIILEEGVIIISS